MPKRFGTINHMGNPFATRSITITPPDEDVRVLFAIENMKRGSRREQFRSLPDTIVIGNRSLPVRWVA